jgi:hypothetical protein
MPNTIQFECAERAGRMLAVDAHPQTTVMPGDSPNTAVVNTPDGQRMVVKGDSKDIQVQIQAAAAQGHESGDAPRKNTSMS